MESLQEIMNSVRHVDIDISEEDIEFLKPFVNSMVIEKNKESHRIADSTSMNIREMTGKIGELAIERWLKIPFLDISIGNTKDYNIPDLRTAGYEMGCKTVTIKNLAPLVPRNPKIPELICIWDAPQMKVHIMGIASIKTLKENQDDSLVICKEALGRKTGFGNYKKLLPPTSFWMDQYKST